MAGVVGCWPCQRHVHPKFAQDHLLDFHSGSGVRFTDGGRAVVFTQMARPAVDDVCRDLIEAGNLRADAEEKRLQEQVAQHAATVCWDLAEAFVCVATLAGKRWHLFRDCHHLQGVGQILRICYADRPKVRHGFRMVECLTCMRQMWGTQAGEDPAGPFLEEVVARPIIITTTPEVGEKAKP